MTEITEYLNKTSYHLNVKVLNCKQKYINFFYQNKFVRISIILWIAEGA